MLRNWALACLVAGALAGCNADQQVNLASPATDAGASAMPATAEAVPARGRASTRGGPDARQQAPLAPRYYIEFRSRAALSYGHTFAALGQLKPDGSIGTMEIVGLHPATESPVPWMLGHLVFVPSETGPSDGDTEEFYVTARYRITMDKDRFDQLMRYVRGLQASSPAWHAVFYNCNAFVGDIARHMGLQAPGNTLLYPQDYINELKRLNQS